jgi:hypothetical protein
MKIQTVSSRWTFILKLAFPLFWLIFMGGITLLVCFSPLDNLREPFDPITAKGLVLSFYLTVLLVFYWLFMRAKWVALSETNLYVSNFFRSYKYTYDSLSGFEETNMFIFTRVVLHFHQPTKFGKSIFFVRSYYWKHYLEKHPEVLAQIFAASADGGLITEEEEKSK